MLAGGKGVIGLGIWFSNTENYEMSAVDYYVNPVYLAKQKEEEEEQDD